MPSSHSTPSLSLDQARLAGYCIVSRRYRLAARLDQPDWKAVLAATQPDGKAWVRNLGDQQAADYYRRCISKDTITVPAAWISSLGNSGEGPSDYRPASA